jgi:antitoxin CptB
MVSETEFKRICWGSRRGMLELDLIMGRYANEFFMQGTDEEQQLYINLLECEDTDLFAWFMGHRKADAEHEQIVNVIRSATRPA